MTITFVETGGGRVAVEVEGEGPLVVCSPALGDTRDAFAPFAAHLVAHGYRVARVDLRGHGDSTARFSRYGDEATAEDLLAVVDALGAGPAVLAGASISAAAAVIAAARRPSRITGVILLAPFLRNGMGPVMRAILHVALAWPWGPAVWRAQAAKLWPGLGDEAVKRAAASTASLTRPGRWAAFHATSAADHRVVAPSLNRVRAPVLVVMGDADPDWKDPLGEARWVASNFADCEIVAVPGAGHAPMLEKPDLVGPSAVRFLARIRAGGASATSHA